jgi:hypothetical protein
MSRLSFRLSEGHGFMRVAFAPLLDEVLAGVLFLCQLWKSYNERDRQDGGIPLLRVRVQGHVGDGICESGRRVGHWRRSRTRCTSKIHCCDGMWSINPFRERMLE